MKILFYTAFLTLLCNTSHACFNNIDTIRRYKSGALYQENFDDQNQCTTTPENKAAVQEELAHLKTLFPYDYTLDIYLARLNGENPHDVFMQELNIYAKTVYLPNQEHCIKGAQNFTKKLEHLVVDGKNILRLYGLVCLNIQTLMQSSTPAPINDKHRTSRSTPHIYTLKKNVIDSSFTVFSLLDTDEYVECRDALLAHTVIAISSMCPPDLTHSVIDRVYQTAKIKSDYLTLTWAGVLLDQKQFTHASKLYESVLGITRDDENPYQSAFYYDRFVRSLLCTYLMDSNNGNTGGLKKDLLKQLHILKKMSSVIEEDYLGANANLCMYYLLIGKYKQSLKNYHNLTQASHERLLSHGITKRFRENLHQALVQNAGHLEEATDLLLAHQQRVMGKNAKIVSLIKTHQALHPPAPPKTKIAPQPKKETTTTTLSEGPLNLANQAARPKAPGRPIKKKVKPTQNTTSASTTTTSMPSATTTTTALAQKTQPCTLYIDEITTNKNAINTFYLLFAKYLPDIKTDNNVSLSLHEVQSLFKAIGQNYDPKAGKGSHKKGTLKFENEEYPMEEQMTVLTKSTHLKPYQIKKLRKAFVLAGIIPRDPDILKKLQEEGLL